jgi:hypothetical protein
LKGVPDRQSKSELILLDEEWRQGQYSTRFPLYPDAKEFIDNAIYSDTQFLSGQNIMDYSLLVGVDDQKHTLIVGIVDFIGPYTWYKAVETQSKSLRMKNITVIPPDSYRDRFRKAMNEYFVMVPDKATKFERLTRLPRIV